MVQYPPKDNNPPAQSHEYSENLNLDNKNSEILQVFHEVRSLHEANLQATKERSIFIILLLILGIGILSYLCYYILQFKPKEVDEFVQAGIESLERNDQVQLPLTAKIQLTQNPNTHPIFWDETSQTWKVDVKGEIRPLASHSFIRLKAWQDIRDLGFVWEKGKWKNPKIQASDSF